jgi:kumamolisin
VRFGLPRARIDSVGRTLEDAGLRVVRTYAQRTALEVAGTVGQVGRLFAVKFGDYADASGRRYRDPLTAPRIPASLSDAVVGVTGLSTRPVIRKASSIIDIPDPGRGLTPKDVARAYDAVPLQRLGLNGQGHTVALVSFASFDPADVAGFDRTYGLQGPPVRSIPVRGGAGPTQGDPNCDIEGFSTCHSSEVNLDIDVIRGLVPRAQILNYEAPNGRSTYGDVVNAIVADGRADIVSISWGQCDVPDRLRLDARLAGELAFQAAVASGISIFVASGDAGAYECGARNRADERPTVSYPASSPFVVSVGGTLLSVRNDGSYLEEAGWEDILSRGGSGGGLSPLDPRPPWQVAPGVDNEFSNGARQLPDVAAAADSDSGFSVFAGKRLHESPIGGTSAAAPFWAASMLLIGQYAESKGVRDLGFVSPLLYRLAATQQRFPPFHDVTRGGNRLFNCGPGWDYATGLGSPDVFNLARDIVAQAK